MANFKADIEVKLIKEKDNVLKTAPGFLKDYINKVLVLSSNELRSHISYAKNIMTFLNYYGHTINKEPGTITLIDMNSVSSEEIYLYLKYLTQYKVKFTTSTGKEVTRIRSNSNTSKAKKLAALKKLYKYLLKNHLVSKDPTEEVNIKKPDITKLSNKLDTIGIKEMSQAIEHGTNISSNKAEKAFNRLHLRDITIFCIIAYTGIRVSELVSMDITDIDTNRCTIKVTRKDNKIQELPYPEDISEYIEKYLEYRDTLKNKVHEECKKALFLSQQMKRISEQSVRILLKKYAARCNINDLACHTLRRTFLSSFYNQTHDIRATAKLGGHSVSTASKYYADVDEERLRNAVSKFKYK